MKKLVCTIALIATAASSFAQGFFTFTGATRGVWDNYTRVNPVLTNNITVGFLIGSTANTALISGIQSSVPTNAISPAQTWTVSSAWNAIINDSNFRFATNSTGNALVTQTIAANGSFSYNSAGTFGVNGTAAGNNYRIIVVGWNSAYATPFAAALAGSAVGWSAAYTYAAVNNIGTPLSQTASGLLPFGVASPAAIPEPGTFALAGLGGLALLALRRKK